MQYDMFMNYSNTFLIVFQVDMTSFSPHRVCQHSIIRMAYLSDHSYNAEGDLMKEIPARRRSYIYLVY